MSDQSTETMPTMPPANRVVKGIPLDCAQGEASKQPPRAPLVLRVGVVGHYPSKKRPAPDVPELRTTCRKLLLHIQDTFAGVAIAHRDLFCKPPASLDGKPLSGLRLISALADGADQWVAAEAEQLGYELQTVLPFERNEYEKDFGSNSNVLAEHRRLRGLATAVFELDGCRAHEGESYLAAGLVLLTQTDLLIALWDGEKEQGTGGTGQLVHEALRRGIPTLWVNWASPTQWCIKRADWRLLKEPDDIQGDLRLLTNEVIGLLIPPCEHRIGDNPETGNPREEYFAEFQRSWNWGGVWNSFRHFVCGQLTWPELRVPEFISEERKDWRNDWEGDGKKRQPILPGAISQWIEKSFFLHYAWANGLSVCYADLYRHSFWCIYLLGALAVGLALIVKGAQGTILYSIHKGTHVLLEEVVKDHANAFQTAEIICIGAECLVIASIIFLTWRGKSKRWHERWIDYRTMAEQLRIAGLNAPLGGVWQQLSVPSHLATYGNPAATWMHWHARAVQRAAGLPDTVVSAEYLSGFKQILLDALIVGQSKYHDSNTKRLRRVDHKLRSFGECLFIVTLAACLIHFALALVAAHWPPFAVWVSETGEGFLIFCAAFLPALGAAFAAIRSQGEFHRVVQRSCAMHEKLEQLHQIVANLPTRPNELNSQLLQQASEQTTHLIYNEVLDWRIVFQDRPLVWPA